jgi:ribosomal protein S18 acetylase RimI-like enzyme
MLAIVANDRIKTKHIGEISAVYVQPEYRNQRIGSQLIAEAIKIIKENTDIRKIKISVNTEQKYAVRLYKKHGFNKVGIAKDQYYINGRYYDELLMERFI